MYGTDESIQTGLDKYNREDWVDLVDWLVDNGPAGTGSPDTPVLQAWTFVTRYGDGPQHRAVRNPYYFKVDPEGNQLPYIDEIVYDLVEDVGGNRSAGAERRDLVPESAYRYRRQPFDLPRQP